jgi:Flp pilus assembly protein CpaB
MAEEERSGVQNVWLLLIALGLGVVVVVVYNVHIHRVRMEGRGRTLRLLKLTRDLEVGERIKEGDVEIGTVPKQFEGSLGNVVDESREEFVVGKSMYGPARKGQWLLWSHLTGKEAARENPLTPGFVAHTVPLNSAKIPGDMLRPNDKVNVMGLISAGGVPRTYRIIEDVRVMAVGGKALDPGRAPSRSSRAAGSRIYRSVTIEVKPDVSLELANVLTHVDGDCWLELRSKTERKIPNAGQIDPALKNLAGKARIVERGRSGSAAGGDGGGFGTE